MLKDPGTYLGIVFGMFPEGRLEFSGSSHQKWRVEDQMHDVSSWQQNIGQRTRHTKTERKKNKETRYTVTLKVK